MFSFLCLHYMNSSKLWFKLALPVKIWHHGLFVLIIIIMIDVILGLKLTIILLQLWFSSVATLRLKNKERLMY